MKHGGARRSGAKAKKPTPAEVEMAAMERKRLASLATQKFDFLNIVNADPLVPPSALKIVLHYLQFVDDLKADAVYASILDLQVVTGLSRNTIMDIRKKLLDLGYFEPAGKTAAGIPRYRLRLQRANVVLDHMIVAREKLRDDEAIRKEGERLRREAKGAKSAPPQSHDRGPEIELTNAVWGSKISTDVSSDFGPNHLYYHLDSFSYERKDSFHGDGSPPSNGYQAVKDGDDVNLPYPVPESEAEAVEMLTAIFEGCDQNPAFLTYFRKKLLDGKLTPSDIENHLRAVA